MGSSAANRARADLEKQLVELSRLRNANTRDPDFKVWRQTTLTLIQRIWVGDDSRSGRFRGVPFSPATSRADTKLAREWFERGCAEAARILRSLIEEINEHGVVKGAAPVMAEPESLPEDENVPILSLDESESHTTSGDYSDEPDDLRLSDDVEPADAEYEEDELGIPDIPDPPGARSPKPVSRPMAKAAPPPARAEAPKAPAAKPAAPRSAAPPEAKSSAGGRRASDQEIPISETAPPGPSRGVTVSNGGGSKSAAKKPPAKEPVAKDRLKDMLGFEPGSKVTSSAEPTPSAPPSRPAPTHTPRPAAPAGRAATPRREPPPPPTDLQTARDHFGTIAPESVAPLDESGASEDFAPPARSPRAACPAPPRAAPPRPAPPRAEPPRAQQPVEETWESEEAEIMDDVMPIPLESPAPAGNPPDAEPWTSEPQSGVGAPQGYDENALKRAFEAALQSFVKRRGDSQPAPEPVAESEPDDLLGSSPVFNVTARPVKRRAEESGGRYHTATGIAMAAIATEVEAMGVPATDCSQARAALLELADHFERRDLTWDTVRDAVRLLVEYPVVARRVLPLLVPHLDEAA